MVDDLGFREYNIISKENEKVILSREEYEALLDTFRNLQVATQRAVSRLETLQAQTVRVVEPVPAKVPSSNNKSTAHSKRATSARRTGYLDTLEGNGAEEQFGFKKKDIVHITNQVVIGSYTLLEFQRTGAVQYFTDRFVVVSLKYKFNPDDEEEAFKYKLVKRESQNIQLIRRNVSNPYN